MLGAANENARATESQKLLNWGYSAYEAVRLFAPGQAVVTPTVLERPSGPSQTGSPRWGGCQRCRRVKPRA